MISKTEVYKTGAGRHLFSVLIYALQLDGIASQGAGVKALCRSMFLPAPVNCGAKPVPQGTSFARSDSGQELRPHTPPASRLPAPDDVGQNLSRKVRASPDQIRDRSFAPTPRLPHGFPRRLIVGPGPVRCGLRPQLFLSRAGASPRRVRASLDQIRDRSCAPHTTNSPGETIIS